MMRAVSNSDLLGFIIIVLCTKF